MMVMFENVKRTGKEKFSHIVIFLENTLEESPYQFLIFLRTTIESYSRKLIKDADFFDMIVSLNTEKLEKAGLEDIRSIIDIECWSYKRKIKILQKYVKAIDQYLLSKNKKAFRQNIRDIKKFVSKEMNK